MISNNKDLFVQVDKLIKHLEKMGLTMLSAELRDALRMSTLPGEILGELRIVLKKTYGSNELGREQIRNNINEMVNYIDSVLM